jgi:HK97 family phage portal protein
MARRKLLPGLRNLVNPGPPAPPVHTPAPVAPEQAEFKAGWYDSWSAVPGITTVWGTEGRADGWNLDRVISEGYERIPWVFKSIETIAGHQSRLPFAIGRGKRPGEHDDVLDDHPLYRLLNGNANPLETGRMFRKRLSAQLLLSKRGVFIEVTKSRMGTLTRLDLLPPDRMHPVPDPKGEYIDHFELLTRDGRLRELPTDRVRWLRDPHPTDPFSSVTPLEAAGISVDLDYLARLYNVSFLQNDGRPGGVIGVATEGVSERQLDRIEAKFAPGVDNAGQLVAIGTGPGGITFVDPSAKPRDMSYGDLAKNAKDEILSTFGVPESMTGNASQRTYDNAEQEEFNFWSITELPHLDLVASAFLADVDYDEGWRPFIDTSTIECLELPRRKRLEKLREEFNAGLITADEYREAAGRPVINNPQTRALWMSPQKAPVPTRPEDAAALGVGGGQAPGGMPGAQVNGQPGQPPAAGGGPAAAAVEAARGSADGSAPAGPAAAAVDSARGTAGQAKPGTTAAAAAVDAARRSDSASQPGAAAAAVAAAGQQQTASQPGPAAAAVDEARVETKGLPNGQDVPATQGWEPSAADTDRLISSLSAALDALLARQQEVITARLRSPKARKGTRFWSPGEYSVDTRSGDAPIDAGKVVTPQRWSEETTATLTPLITAAMQATAADCIMALTGAPASDTTMNAATGGMHAAMLGALGLAAAAVEAFLSDVASFLTTAQRQPVTLDALIAGLRDLFTAHSRRLAEATATAVAPAAINGAAEAAAGAVSPQVTRTWITQRDDRVRPAHRAVDGENLPVLESFDVGGYPMRYPGDPIAPPGLTRNCRCRLLYHPTEP